MKNTDKTLFKKDSNNRIRVWNIWTDGGILAQTTGVLGGQLVLNSKYCTPKNIGRANETDEQTQALLELESAYKKKLDEGYFKTEEEAKNSNVILPMLAKDYKKESHKINWNKDLVCVQRKYDGMRCLAFCKEDGSVKLMSRDGKIIENMMHIEKELSTIKKDIILDGELFSSIEDNFQTNMTHIKKYRVGQSEKINFNIYDIINEYSFYVRNTLITKDVFLGKTFKHILQVDTKIITSEEQLKEYHSQFIEEGYEGTMVRISKTGYKVDGRSSELLKYKDFLDMDCKIISIGPCKQRPEWGRPVVEYGDGKQIPCGTKMTHEQRKDLLINKEQYIGKIGNVRYFGEYDGGSLRFPILVGIHGDR